MKLVLSALGFSLMFLAFIPVDGATNNFAEGKLTENGIQWCEEELARYELWGEEKWIVEHNYSIEARICAHLYIDPLWEYQGNDRVEKLIERSGFYAELEIAESQKEAKTGVIDPTPAESKVPDWVRNNADWWSQGMITDGDFLSGIQFLIDEKIMVISATSKTEQATLPFVPNWIKDTAGWWATGKVTDNDFINGMKWLIENGIIRV
jgi:hypothetical protein